jgi:hypothetical protein
MQLSARKEWLKGILPEGHVLLANTYNEEASFQAYTLTDEQLEELQKVAQSVKGSAGSKYVKLARSLEQKITAQLRIRKDPGVTTPKILTHLEAALHALISQTPRKWIFVEKKDGAFLPFFVNELFYNPPSPRDHQEASVRLNATASFNGSKISIGVTFRPSDLHKGAKTVSQLLADEGFLLETPELVAQYEEALAVYDRHLPLSGEQFLVSGLGRECEEDGSTGWSSRYVPMMIEGVPSRVVLDQDYLGEGSGGRESSRVRSRGEEFTGYETTPLWSSPMKVRKRIRLEEDDEPVSEEDLFDEDETKGKSEVFAVPVHPYLKVFDLTQHEFAWVYAPLLVPYEYDNAAADKLVMAEHKKNLVNLLVQGSDELMEDIIKGKSGGIIVIATGPPGTGKTLTAEVYSERVKRPLYVVQCSQLGTSEEELEKRLRVTLARATRWKAILLIDEADVYVHERGGDIQQNAVVGVFLRVLEYYRGVLFMTSNRDTVIDDAILSRATAWIRYTNPSTSELAAIWSVLSRQYDVKLSKKAIDELVAWCPQASGRSVKNLLKLSRLLANKGEKPVDVELIQYVSQFQDIEFKEGPFHA